MNRQLHILKNPDDREAIALIRILADQYPEKITVVLIQDAVTVVPSWKSPTYCVIDDSTPEARPAAGVESIGYDRLIDLIFETDTVLGW